MSSSELDNYLVTSSFCSICARCLGKTRTILELELYYTPDRQFCIIIWLIGVQMFQKETSLFHLNGVLYRKKLLKKKNFTVLKIDCSTCVSKVWKRLNHFDLTLNRWFAKFIIHSTACSTVPYFSLYYMG